MMMVSNDKDEAAFARRMLRAVAAERGVRSFAISAAEVHALRGDTPMDWPKSVAETAAQLLPELAARPGEGGVTVRRIHGGDGLWEVSAEPIPVAVSAPVKAGLGMADWGLSAAAAPSAASTVNVAARDASPLAPPRLQANSWGPWVSATARVFYGPLGGSSIVPECTHERFPNMPKDSFQGGAAPRKAA